MCFGHVSINEPKQEICSKSSSYAVTEKFKTVKSKKRLRCPAAFIVNGTVKRTAIVRKIQLSFGPGNSRRIRPASCLKRLLER